MRWSYSTGLSTKTMTHLLNFFGLWDGDYRRIAWKIGRNIIFIIVIQRVKLNKVTAFRVCAQKSYTKIAKNVYPTKKVFFFVLLCDFLNPTLLTYVNCLPTWHFWVASLYLKNRVRPCPTTGLRPNNSLVGLRAKRIH